MDIDNYKIELANCLNKLANKKLVVHNFGNASSLCNDICLIKPSGYECSRIDKNDIVEYNIKTKIFKENNPSIDLPFHLEIYKISSEIKSIIHAHPKYLTAWAQSNEEIPCLGTTHADYWPTSIPITRKLSKREIDYNYEKNIGLTIYECIQERDINILSIPGLLLNNHGAVTWGKTINEALLNMEIMEYIAEVAYLTINLNKNSEISKDLINKHYFRKNGNSAYYGQ